MSKKKKFFGKEIIKEEPIFEEKVEEVKEEIKEEVKEDLPVSDVVVEEEVKEEAPVKEEPKGREIVLMINDIVEIADTDIGFIPVRGNKFEFAGCEVECIRNFGKRIFIKILRII